MTVVDPFVCTFCHSATNCLLSGRFGKSMTPSGEIVDHSPLRHALTMRLTPVQVCEVREHSLACGHVVELLEKMMVYLGGVELSLSVLEAHVRNNAFGGAVETLEREIAAKRAIVLKQTTVVMELVEEMRRARQEQVFLPALRDATIKALL